MQLAIIDSSYTGKYGLADGLRLLKSHGYSAIDYQGFINTETPLWQKSDSSFETQLQYLKETLDNIGLSVCQTHAPWCWPPKNSTLEDRRERFEKMHKALKGTKLLGAKYFVIHPIMPYENTPNQNDDEVWAVNAGFLGRVADYAKYYGITICLENMPFENLCLSTPRQVLEFVEDMNHPNLKICLDTGHCACIGLNPSDAVRMIGKEWLKCIHVHDNDGKADLHLRPGSGIVDWNDFGKALHEIDYSGFLSLECDLPDTPKEQAALARTATEIAGNCLST
ncbi:MAG: sugar phosphate isomerase/epimerase [Lentisphaeria bacterium]|nr:sugar phosphate isomerase/epimerase [Lentisphaeria bacterium]